MKTQICCRDDVNPEPSQNRILAISDIACQNLSQTETWILASSSLRRECNSAQVHNCKKNATSSHAVNLNNEMKTCTCCGVFAQHTNISCNTSYHMTQLHVCPKIRTSHLWEIGMKYTVALSFTWESSVSWLYLGGASKGLIYTSTQCDCQTVRYYKSRVESVMHQCGCDWKNSAGVLPSCLQNLCFPILLPPILFLSIHCKHGK